MGQTINIKLKGFLGMQQGKSDPMTPANCAVDCCNVETRGGVLKRMKGFTALCAPVSDTANIKRAYIWSRRGLNDLRISCSETDLYCYNSLQNAWISFYTISEQGLDMDSVSLLRVKIGDDDYLLIANGQGAILKWDGVIVNAPTPFGSAELGSSAPVSMMAMHYGRLFSAGSGVSPCRLYWSCAPGGTRTIENWGASDDGADVSGGYVEVGIDSDPITGLFALSNQLVIFKRNRLYRLIGDRPSNYRIVTVPASFPDVNRSLCVTYADRLFFLTELGLYYYDGQNVYRTQNGAALADMLKSADFSCATAAAVNDRLCFAFRKSSASTANDVVIEYDVLRDCFLTRSGFKATSLFEHRGRLYIVTDGDALAVFDDSNSYCGARINAYWQTPRFDFETLHTSKRALLLSLSGRGGLMKADCIADGDERSAYARLPDETGTADVPLTGEGRAISIRLSNVNGSDFEITDGPELCCEQCARPI